MNPGNLISNADLTPSERSESARRAGKASAAKKRQRKMLRETLEAILSGAIEVDGAKVNAQEALGLALVKKGLNGDVSAFYAIRDTIGEKPVDKAEVDATVKIVMDKSTKEYSE